MSLVLSGNSGSMTVDSSAGITFPYGTNPQDAPSKVLQVVQGTYLAVSSVASATFTATGLTATITPLFSTSKILVMVNCNIGETGSSDSTYLTVYRNGTDINPETTTPKGFIRNFTGSTTQGGGQSVLYLDSPSSTSSLTYTLMLSNDGQGGTAYIGRIGVNAPVIQPSIMVLMEIAQ